MRDSITWLEVQGASRGSHTTGLIYAGNTVEHLKSATHLTCFYTNAHSLGNKQELEATMLLENHNVVVTENLWDDSHDTSVAICSYKLFKRDIWGRNEGRKHCPPHQERMCEKLFQKKMAMCKLVAYR